MNPVIRSAGPDVATTIPSTPHDRWRVDRLREARGILADIPQHPETLVILACRVVVGQTDDAGECANAVELWRMLDRRPLQAIAAGALPQGGAA